jgi:hypothetical protein
MKLPRNFFKPLAIGAPAPSNLVHQVDAVPGNLEDNGRRSSRYILDMAAKNAQAKLPREQRTFKNRRLVSIATILHRSKNAC